MYGVQQLPLCYFLVSKLWVWFAVASMMFFLCIKSGDRNGDVGDDGPSHHAISIRIFQCMNRHLGATLHYAIVLKRQQGEQERL